MDCTAELLQKCQSLRMEVELAERDIGDFSQKYNAAGGPPVSKVSEGVIIRKSGKRWGATGRIYFNADQSVVDQLLMLGYRAMEGNAASERGHWNPEYRWRLDSNHLLFLLVRNGFRLGQHCPAAKLPVAQSQAATVAA